MARQETEASSLVAETERFVEAAAEAYAEDVAALKQAVLGREGRPYKYVPVKSEDRRGIYRMLREKDDPEQWAELLRAGASKAVLRWWREEEAALAAESMIEAAAQAAEAAELGVEE